MARHFKAKIALTAGAVLFGTLALSGTAQAANATSIVVYGSYTRAQAVSYGANGAVRVCDTYPDGYGVAVRYYRSTGARQTLRDHDGNGTCTETADIQSNPIILFSACVVIDSVDYCAPSYAGTGR